jgi:hypothetical protein
MKSGSKRAEQILPVGRGGVWGMAQIMYTHVIKCKNDNIKYIIKKSLK